MLLRFSISHHHHFMIKQLLDTAFVNYYVNTRSFHLQCWNGGYPQALRFATKFFRIAKLGSK